jgi:hypothetical protein
MAQFPLSLDGLGVDFTDQRDLFSHRASRAETARTLLHDAGLAHTITVPTGGRARGITYAVTRTP